MRELDRVRALDVLRVRVLEVVPDAVPVSVALSVIDMLLNGSYSCV